MRMGGSLLMIDEQIADYFFFNHKSRKFSSLLCKVDGLAQNSEGGNPIADV